MAENVIQAPPIPGEVRVRGQFRISGAVVLQQEMQISAPAWMLRPGKKPRGTAGRHYESDARVDDWKTANLKPTTDDKDARLPLTPIVSLTSSSRRSIAGTRSGNGSNSWPSRRPPSLLRFKPKPTHRRPHGPSDPEKSSALYDFVSTKYRYMSISLGIGRYKPHTAAEVLSNDYGDCKDKDTLFTAPRPRKTSKSHPSS